MISKRSDASPSTTAAAPRRQRRDQAATTKTAPPLASGRAAENAQPMATRKGKPTAQMKAPSSNVRSTPIGDYGFISDGEVSALLSPNGAVEWMCVPRFDAPSVFGRTTKGAKPTRPSFAVRRTV